MVDAIESFFEVYESDVQRRIPLHRLFNGHSQSSYMVRA